MKIKAAVKIFLKVIAYLIGALFFLVLGLQIGKIDYYFGPIEGNVHVIVKSKCDRPITINFSDRKNINFDVLLDNYNFKTEYWLTVSDRYFIVGYKDQDFAGRYIDFYNRYDFKVNVNNECEVTASIEKRKKQT